MSGLLILPPGVNERMRLEDAINQNRIRAERTHAVAVALKQLDERLSLVPPKGMDQAVEGMEPGYWHVVRVNDVGKPTYWPVDDPKTGKPIEPDSGLVERFRAMDSWDDRVEADRIKARIQRKRDQEHAEALLRGEIRDELRYRAKAMISPGVSFSDGPWAWRHNRRKSGVILP